FVEAAVHVGMLGFDFLYANTIELRLQQPCFQAFAGG
ncbi:MAG: hypothetical protein RLZ68_267, partial [Pseudomonadota bacterium]